jgi:hypothetical protein
MGSALPDVQMCLNADGDKTRVQVDRGRKHEIPASAQYERGRELCQYLRVLSGRHERIIEISPVKVRHRRRGEQFFAR